MADNSGLKEKLKIMQIAPFGLPIREDIRYGGVETIIRDLAKEFDNLGHESYVAATADSEVAGKLCPTLPKSSWMIRGNKSEGWKYEKNVAAHDSLFEQHSRLALQQILTVQPDIIHDHYGFVRSEAFRTSSELPPILTTLHGPLNKDNMNRFEDLSKKVAGRDVHFNAISESQKRDFSRIINVDYLILHGLNPEVYPYHEEGEGYLFSMSLISPAKGQDIALNAAEHLGKKIILAGPIHHFVPEINDFWEISVKPRIEVIEDQDIPPEQVGDYVASFMKSKHRSVYVGELNNPQKKEWYKRADAFLHPIRWQEPFGLVMIESMACGTPVVAYNGGAVPEVVSHGKTGFVAEQGNFDQFVHYLSQVNKISRRTCREYIKENFSIEREASDFIRVYREIISKPSKNLESIS